MISFFLIPVSWFFDKLLAAVGGLLLVLVLWSAIENGGLKGLDRQVGRQFDRVVEQGRVVFDWLGRKVDVCVRKMV